MNPTLADQLAHEEHIIDAGRRRYRAQQEATIARDASASGGGSSLIRHYLPQVAEHIELFMAGRHPEGRRRTAAARLVSGLEPNTLAYLTLRAMIECLFQEGNTPAQTIFIGLGRSCEDELRFSKFEIDHPHLYKHTVEAFERKRTISVSHKRSVLTAVSPDEFEWHTWSTQDRFKVGGLLFGLAMEVTDIVLRSSKIKNGPRGKPRTEFRLRPTESVLDWLDKHGQHCEDLRPDRLPCVIPPAPWTNWTNGGYYSPRLRSRTPLIKGRSYTAEKRRLYDACDMPEVLSAVNHLQNTKWQVNTPVLEIAREVWKRGLGGGLPSAQPLETLPCPLPEGVVGASLEDGDPLKVAFEEWKAVTAETHTREKKRHTQSMAIHRVMRVAADFEDGSPMWFVWQLDFRGRAYSASGALNPQGMDLSKGLLRFYDAKPLKDREGYRWFMVNGANKYGFDKASYAEREQWALDGHDTWLAVANEPISNIEFWEKADKPFQFLAWCLEYKALTEAANPFEFRSQLPVGMDGSCNGLQHFSAMLRDPIGGAAVNLLPNDKPADIYQRVADRLHEKLLERRHTEPEAANWLRALGGSVPRKLLKPPVMTLPYGSTQRTCTQTTMAWVMDNIYDEFEENTAFLHCIWITPLIWSSIGEIVIAARVAMDWVQKCASVATKQKRSIVYYTALGFPVVQQNFKQVKVQIRTQMLGDLQLALKVDTSAMNGSKQRNSASPNLVHSSDGTHEQMATNRAAEAGIDAFAMIHDDFGCHAGDAEEFNQIIRDTFADLHGQTSVLEDYAHWLSAWVEADMPRLPEGGELDIDEVRQSEYFFG